MTSSMGLFFSFFFVCLFVFFCFFLECNKGGGGGYIAQEHTAANKRRWTGIHKRGGTYICEESSGQKLVYRYKQWDTT